jgi:hypothetical protein
MGFVGFEIGDILLVCGSAFKAEEIELVSNGL